MRKRRICLVMLILAVAGLVGLIVAGAWRPRNGTEPEYAGRRLSQWVMELPADTSPTGQSVAEVAIRNIGTNALPYLLKWISYEPAPWRLKLYERIGRFLKVGPNTLFQDKKMLLAAGAAQGFLALGRDAEPAITELGRLARNPHRGMSRLYAFFAFHGEEARSRNSRFRNASATVYVGADTYSLTYGTNGLPLVTFSHTNVPAALPALFHSLEDPDSQVRVKVTNALRRIDRDALERGGR